MANNYYDATGVLVLEKVTPIISALFGGFNVDDTYPGNGKAYIAKISEENNPTWDDVLHELQALVKKLGKSLPEDAEETIEEYLYLLASHLRIDTDEVFENLIEHNDFEDCADLGVLFELALRLDDGHGLNAMMAEGCWYCTKPRLFEFGGEGQYFGRHCYVGIASTSALQLGTDLDAALEAKDLNAAANLVFKEVTRLLTGVTNDQSRNALRIRVGNALAAGAHNSGEPT